MNDTAIPSVQFRAARALAADATDDEREVLAALRAIVARSPT